MKQRDTNARIESADASGIQPIPDSQQTHEPETNILFLFIALMVTMLLASLSQTVLSTALPTIVGELGGVEHMTWVITGYILASTVMMPVYGRISDQFGRKPIIFVAIVLFVGGSVIGGVAESMNLLVTARVVQGLGGGGLIILSQSAIADVIPARERGRYMGFMAGVFALSSVAGPLLGGWLTEGPGWRWAFWLNVPLGIAAIVAVFAFLHLPKQARGKLRIDYLGMVLVATATVAVVLVCTWGGHQYAWTSPVILGLIAVAVVTAGLFVLVESKAAHPVMPLGLFTNRNFVLATVAGLLVGSAMFGVLGYMPTYIQMVLGVNATQAGLLMIPMMGGLFVTSVLAGQLVSRLGRYKYFPVVGSVLMAAGLYAISTLAVDSPLWVLCTYLAMFGVGLGLAMPILTLIVQDAFPGAVVGTATAATNYFRQVGATVGSAIVGAVFATRLTAQLRENLAAVAAQGGAQVETGSLRPAAVLQLPDPIRQIIVESYNHALLPILFWLVPVAVMAAVVLVFVREKALSTTVDREVLVE